MNIVERIVRQLLHEDQRIPIYNEKGWVLGRCERCGTPNYVEPHGMTAMCRRCRTETDHENIPFGERDFSGNYLVIPWKKSA
jgi:hypothetical protein